MVLVVEMLRPGQRPHQQLLLVTQLLKLHACMLILVQAVGLRPHSQLQLLPPLLLLLASSSSGLP